MSGAVLVINGHPDRSEARLCHALATAYLKGCVAGGIATHRIDVAALDFPMLRTQDDFENGTPCADILAAQDAVRAAEHIVLIYPLWLGTMPALLKGFLEQTLRPGFAFSYDNDSWSKKALIGKSARIVITMGMPALAYRWIYGAHSLKSLERNILKFCGIRPIRDTLIGGVDNASHTKRTGWLRQVERLGRLGQ